MAQLQSLSLEVFIAVVIGSEVENSQIIYTVQQEGPVPEISIGVPMFQFGYNSYRYDDNARVFCIKSSRTPGKAYILGQIYNPNVNILNGQLPPRKNEMILNSGGSINSGIDGLGKTDRLKIWVGKNSSSFIDLNAYNSKLQVMDSGFNFEKSSFSLMADGVNLFELIQGKSRLISKLGFKLFAGDGPVGLSGNTFYFYQDNTIPTETKNTLKKQEKLNPKTEYSIYISEDSQYFNAGKAIFNYREKFSVTTGGVGTSKSSIDFSITKGNFNLSIFTGSVNFNILNPGTALSPNSYSFKIGTSASVFSQMELKEDEYLVEIGPFLPNSIKIDTSSIIITSQGLLGSKGDIKLDGNIEITGNLIVSGKTDLKKEVTAFENIYSTKEVYAKASEFSGEVSTATAVGLSTHITATAVPGPAVPPTVGT